MITFAFDSLIIASNQQGRHDLITFSGYDVITPPPQYIFIASASFPANQIVILFIWCWNFKSQQEKATAVWV